MKRPRCRAGNVRRCLAAATLVVLSASVGAEEFVSYRVRSGDTLYSISERLLQGAADWPLLARLNKLAQPDLLVPGAQLRLPVDRLRGSPGHLTVVYVRGEVVASRSGGVQHVLAAGDAIAENETIRAGPASFASLRLPDGSLIQLEPGSQLQLRQLREIDAADRSRAVFELDGGRIETTVAPQRPGSRFDVRTPLAVAGVRGTRFGVYQNAERAVMTADVLRGSVAVAALADGGAEVAIGQGRGAVVEAGRQGVESRELMAAPDASSLPAIVEEMPWRVDLPPVPGAAGYRIRVAEDAELNRVHALIETADPRFIVQGLTDGRHYVGIRALDRNGLAGVEAVRAVTVKTQPQPPLIQSPAPGATLPLGPVQLLCTGVLGAGGYMVEITDPSGKVTVIESDRAADAYTCRFAVDARFAGEYRWRVATLERDAQGRHARGPFGPVGRFFAAVRPPAPQPRIEAKEGGVAMYWDGAPQMRFFVQVATDPGFERVVQAVEVAEPRVQFDLPPSCRPYYVRLRAHAANALQSEFSVPHVLQQAVPVCDSQGGPISVETGGTLQSGGR